MSASSDKGPSGASHAQDEAAKRIVLSLVPRSYLPDLRGGLEITAHVVAEALIDLPTEGHVAAATAPASVTTRLVRKVLGPYRHSYRVARHRVHVDIFHPADIEALVARLRPSALVCHVAGFDIAKAITGLDLPTLFYVHDRDFKDAFDDVKKVTIRRFAAGSTFIAELVSAATGESTAIIRPPMDPRDYRVDTRGDSVLVVNPHPMKGGNRVVEIARALPQRTFLVVGGWENATRDAEVIKVERALSQLPNVERITCVEDMRTAFRRSRCLLMPCVVEEAFGRAAAEALIAGIPVLASDRGALPETVGSGGVTLSVDAPLTAWIEVLERYFSDVPYYEGLVVAAQLQAMEVDRQYTHVTAEFRRVVGELIVAGERLMRATGRD